MPAPTFIAFDADRPNPAGLYRDTIHFGISNRMNISTVRSFTTLSSFRSALKRHYFQDAFLSQSPRYNW